MVDSNTRSCTLFFLSADLRISNNSQLLQAQQHAIDAGEPLAVCLCLPEISSNHQKLLKTEQQLAQFTIPLMVLLGTLEERLPGLIRHLQPSAVFFDNQPRSVESKTMLQKHRYVWPGRIVSVDELSGRMQ